MSWKTAKLGDICQIGDGAHASLKRVKEGIPYLTAKNVTKHGIDYTSLDYISEATYQKYFKDNTSALTKPKKDDILYSIIGSNIGGVCLVGDEKIGISSSVAIFRCCEKFYPQYVYYYFKSEYFDLQIQSIKGGSAQNFMSLKKLGDVMISYPDYESQRRIASILSAYDDLIENNQKQIKLLEEAAQRLYKEWFVDLRFPGWENTKIVDGVPEGWEKKQICNIADIKAGGDKPETVNKDKSEKTPIPIYANGIEKDGLYGYTTKPVIEKESVTISARGTVGFVFLRRTPYVPIVRLLSVIPDSIPAIYLYYCLKNETFERNGTSQQQITVPMVKNKNLLIADILLIDKFTSIVTEFHDKIDILKTQIEQLTEVRDRLLPKLMSGELEV